jgi:predicted TIM-barrel fold metal-dependent hydrolase
LLYNGVLERYPSIRYVVSHAGGAVPYLAWRIGLGEALNPDLRARVPKGALHYLRRLYYDTALSATDYALAALMRLVPPSQVLFGSDFPFVNDRLIAVEVEGLESSGVLDDASRRAIDRDSALALFPRFAEHR